MIEESSLRKLLCSEVILLLYYAIFGFNMVSELVSLGLGLGFRV